MTFFVRLLATERGNIIQAALSPEVLQSLKRRGVRAVDPGAVEVLLDYLFQHDDLWYEDALSLHPHASGAYFAIKKAFQSLNLTPYAIPEGTLEEEHIINMLKKHGYWPWY